MVKVNTIVKELNKMYDMSEKMLLYQINEGKRLQKQLKLNNKLLIAFGRQEGEELPQSLNLILSNSLTGVSQAIEVAKVNLKGIKLARKELKRTMST